MRRDFLFFNIFFNYYFNLLFNSGTFSVEHCSSMMHRVGCKNSQTLPWSELTARSLSTTTPDQKSDAGMEQAVMKTKFWALPGSEPGTHFTRVKNLNHSVVGWSILLKERRENIKTNFLSVFCIIIIHVQGCRGLSAGWKIREILYFYHYLTNKWVNFVKYVCFWGWVVGSSLDFNA